MTNVALKNVKLMVKMVKSFIKIGPVTAEIILKWTNVARTNVAWTNVNMTVNIC